MAYRIHHIRRATVRLEARVSALDAFQNRRFRGHNEAADRLAKYLSKM
jgi:hypothetical protein